MNGVHKGTIFFGPTLWGPVDGPKGQISLNFKIQLQSQFQISLNQTFCVFSQIKDIKHIRPDFHLVAWVMPQGWDFGAQGGWRGQNLIFFSKFNQICCVSYSHECSVVPRSEIIRAMFGPLHIFWGHLKFLRAIYYHQ